jgi:hypothetical protein
MLPHAVTLCEPDGVDGRCGRSAVYGFPAPDAARRQWSRGFGDVSLRVSYRAVGRGSDRCQVNACGRGAPELGHGRHESVKGTPGVVLVGVGGQGSVLMMPGTVFARDREQGLRCGDFCAVVRFQRVRSAREISYMVPDRKYGRYRDVFSSLNHQS